MVSAGIVYGRRGEVYERSSSSLKEFVNSTFEIENVFQSKLVMGRCICHGKKTLETDVLLNSEEDAINFISAPEVTKPHILLIYDKLADCQSIKEQKAENEADKDTNVTISSQQWNELMSSIKDLQTSLKKQEKREAENISSYILHTNIFCDGCSSPHDEHAQEIRGVRYKCLTCPNFDLCSSCEHEGFENNIHKKNHNMIKINTPAFIDMEAQTRQWGRAHQFHKSKNEKEVVIDIPEEEKELFDMFQDLQKLKEVSHGFKFYKKWISEYGDEDSISKKLARPITVLPEETIKPNTSNNPINLKQKLHSKQISESIKVSLNRKDTTLFFNLSNLGTVPIEGGLSLIYSISDDTITPSTDSNNNDFMRVELCKLPMGPHELLPSQTKTLRFNYYPRVLEHSIFENGNIKIVKSNGKNIYESKQVDKSRTNFILVKSECTGQPPLRLKTFIDSNSSLESYKLLEKEDSDGVISSNITNDDDTLRSASSQDSNWDEYDFLSESDV